MIAIIIDDDELALIRLHSVLSKIDGVTVAGNFNNHIKAVRYLQKKPVDVVFMNIEMANVTGNELANVLLHTNNTLELVCLTSNQNGIIDLFDENGMEYLLKPYSIDSIQRIARHMRKNIHKSEKRTGIRIQCFPDFQVCDSDNNRIRFKTFKTEELFAFIVHNEGRRIYREEVISVLWPFMRYDRAEVALSLTFYQMLCDLSRSGFVDVVRFDTLSFWIDVHKVTCDYYKYRECMDQIQSQPHDLKNCKKIADLYKDGYMIENGYDWTEEAEKSINETFLIAMDTYSRKLDEAGKFKEEQKLLLQMINLLPFREDLHKRLLLSYIQTGDVNLAKNHYETIQKAFFEVVGKLPAFRLDELKSL